MACQKDAQLHNGFLLRSAIVRRGYKLFNTSFILFGGQEYVNRKYKVEEEDKLQKTENYMWERLCSKRERPFQEEGSSLFLAGDEEERMDGIHHELGRWKDV